MKKVLYRSDVWLRTGLLWLAFMVTTWLVAGIAYLTHPQAWQNVPAVQPEKGWNVFFFIIISNVLLCGLIVLGNLFVRFGAVTAGLLILFWQAVVIGWTAGTNGFAEPFPSFSAANTAFLLVGLWETTAYVLICAVTVTKSRLISEAFPAQGWSQQRRWADVSFSRAESFVIALSGALLVGAAAVEAFVLYGGG